MAKSTPFLVETTDREAAFPDIASLEIAVKQDRYGFYTDREGGHLSKFDKMTVPRNLSCVNPRCQQGGLDLQQIILYWQDGDHFLSCNGHEGTPAGRKTGDPCDNNFDISLKTHRIK